jgi:hypothetical protein
MRMQDKDQGSEASSKTRVKMSRCLRSLSCLSFRTLPRTFVSSGA